MHSFRLLFLLLWVLFSQISGASVRAFFKSDKVTLVIQGVSDSDAQDFYDLLSVTEENQGSFFSKTAQVHNKTIVFVCVKSQATGVSQCTLSFERQEGVLIHPSEKILQVEFLSTQAKVFFELFPGLSFQSQDRRLKLESGLDRFFLYYQ